MATSEVNATPAAVELADVNGVDVNDVDGTGAGGKVTVDDVRGHIEAAGDEVTPVSQERIDELRGDAEGATAGVIGGPTPSEDMTAEQLPGDVDVADLDDTEYEGEKPPLILAGYWVKLGVHESVPEGHEGDIAAVLESPWTNVPFAGDSETEITGYRFDEEKDYLVKLRGADESIFEVPVEAISASAQDRPTLLSYA